MNIVALIGRLTRDIELKYTQSGKPVANFSLAVDRRYKDANGEKVCDFINCISWEKKAELLDQYCKKGSQIAVTGELQMRKYQTREGENRTAFEVLVDQVQFLGGNRDGNQSADSQESHGSQTGPVSDADLPF